MKRVKAACIFQTIEEQSGGSPKKHSLQYTEVLLHHKLFKLDNYLYHKNLFIIIIIFFQNIVCHFCTIYMMKFI